MASIFFFFLCFFFLSISFQSDTNEIIFHHRWNRIFRLRNSRKNKLDRVHVHACVCVCVYVCVHRFWISRNDDTVSIKKKKKKKLKDRAFVSFDDKSWSVLEELIIEIFISSSSFPDTIERPANQALGWSTYRHNEYANRPAFGYICFNELRSGSFAEERS